MNNSCNCLYYYKPLSDRYVWLICNLSFYFYKKAISLHSQIHQQPRNFFLQTNLPALVSLHLSPAPCLTKEGARDWAEVSSITITSYFALFFSFNSSSPARVCRLCEIFGRNGSGPVLIGDIREGESWRGQILIFILFLPLRVLLKKLVLEIKESFLQSTHGWI